MKVSTKDMSGAEDMRPGQCCLSPDGFLECWVWQDLPVVPEETVPGPFGADSIMPAMLTSSLAMLSMC